MINSPTYIDEYAGKNREMTLKQAKAMKEQMAYRLQKETA